MNRNRPNLLHGSTVTQWILYVTVAISLASTVLSWIGIRPWIYLAFIPALADIQPWRFLTVVLVHGGFIHLALNMFTLYIVGPTIERALGSWRYLALYLLSAVGGSLAVLAWVLVSPSSIGGASVGASGAIFGLFAAIYVLQRTAGVDTRAIVILLAINLGYGFIVSGISWQAHLGGMIAGAIVTWVLVRLGKPRVGITAAEQDRQTKLAVGGMFVAAAAIASVLFMALGMWR
ncbi:MAG: rhomboid family intramembrane serine protease [Actinomycetaceae bacterium]|nr:rhomboid family intramembrane serine protease [Actinomycetaceae bacterium]